jgi:hypothetical protein
MLRRAGLDPQASNETREPEGPSHPNDIEGYIFAMLFYISDQRLTCASSRPSIPGSPVQMTPEYVLNPLAIYRMARRTVHEKHAPEESTSPLSSTTSSRKNLPHQNQQRAEYNAQRLPIQGRYMNPAQWDENLYDAGKFF